MIHAGVARMGYDMIWLLDVWLFSAAVFLQAAEDAPMVGDDQGLHGSTSTTRDMTDDELTEEMRLW